MAVKPNIRKKQPVPNEWIIDWRPQGRSGSRERIVFVGTKAEALAHEIDLRRMHRPAVATIISPTLLDALPEFLECYRREVAESTIGDFHWAWKQLEETFAKLRFNQLTPALIESYKSKRLNDGVKKRTINRELSYLSKIVQWAEDVKVCAPFPFRIKRFPKKQTISPRPIVHSPVEIQRVIDEVPENKLGLVLLMYDAGLRRSEAYHIQVEHISLDLRQIRVLGKGSKERLVPIMTERLFKELKHQIKEVKTGYLYTNPRTKEPYKDIRRTLQNASDRAGVNKKIFHHLLRHDHGTHSAMANVDIRAVKENMGHSSVTTTEIYTHLAGEFQRTEGTKFEALIKAVSTRDKKKAKKK
jgi:site-specific recombinase XerD